MVLDNSKNSKSLISIKKSLIFEFFKKNLILNNKVKITNLKLQINLKKSLKNWKNVTLFKKYTFEFWENKRVKKLKQKKTLNWNFVGAR